MIILRAPCATRQEKAEHRQGFNPVIISLTNRSISFIRVARILFACLNPAQQRASMGFLANPTLQTVLC